MKCLVCAILVMMVGCVPPPTSPGTMSVTKVQLKPPPMIEAYFMHRVTESLSDPSTGLVPPQKRSGSLLKPGVRVSCGDCHRADASFSEVAQLKMPPVDGDRMSRLPFDAIAKELATPIRIYRQMRHYRPKFQKGPVYDFSHVMEKYVQSANLLLRGKLKQPISCQSCHDMEKLESSF